MNDARQKNWGPAAGVLLLTILLGPPIGGAIFFVGVLVMSLFEGETIDPSGVFSGFFGSVLFSYLPGGLQAIAMGVASAGVVLVRGFYSRLMAAGLAIASNALILVILYLRDPLTEGFGATLLLFGVFTALSVVAAIVLQAMFRNLGLIKPPMAAA